MLTKKVFQAKKAVKMGKKLHKSFNVVEFLLYKQLISFLIKHVCMQLLKKGRLPKASKCSKFFKNVLSKMAWAVLMLPVLEFIDRKELSCLVAFLLLNTFSKARKCFS